MIRVAALSALLVTWASSLGSGSIKISTDSPLGVADGHSAVFINATVRTSSGALAPDGTLVRFSTDRGHFKEADVPSISGTARGMLIAPTEPGVANLTITASTVGTIATYELEFVKDRSLLTASRQYVDVRSEEYLVYHNSIRVISASGREKLAYLKYRDIEVEAKDLQVDLNQMRVIATDAKLTVAGATLDCKRLKYHFARRRGVAVTTVDGRSGFFEIVGGVATLSEAGMSANEFELADVGVATTSIHAERIVAFPSRQLQFHKAQMYVGDVKVMSLPLYAMGPSADEGIFGGQIVSYTDGGLQLNYPHYLTLSPHHTSVFRVRSGQDYGRGSASSRGFYLDWENTYLIGDHAEGGVTLAGIGRRDMGLSWRHSQRFDSRTTGNAYIDFPSFRSIYGSVNVSRSFDGFAATMNANSSRSFRGTPSETRRYDVGIDTTPKRLDDFPLTYSFGVTANSSYARIANNTSEIEGVGWRGRFSLLPIRLWPGANLTGSLLLTQLWGDRADGRLGSLSTLAVNTPVGQNASMRIAYDYANDSFTSSLTGRHRLSANLNYDDNRFSVSFYGSRSLDIDSSTLLLDTYYALSGLWRVGASISLDSYFGEQIIDQTVILGYRIGQREIGLTYNFESGKFGFTILNAPIR